MSTMVDWPSYLVVGGIEMANAARTLTYLQSGMGGDEFRVNADPKQVYDVLYARQQVPSYSSPEDDPAPWWDTDNPISGEFLGLILDKPAAFDSTTSRDYDQLGGRLGGAAFGRAVNQPRVFQFSGTLCASSAAGLEYGRRWLANRLSSACDPCTLSDLEIYSHMPLSDPNEGYWTFHRVAEVVGVQETQRYACPNLLDVSFTVVAGNPMMFQSEVVQVYPEVLAPLGTRGGPCVSFDDWLCGDPGPLHIATLPAPSSGTNGVIVTITSAGGVNGVEINTYSQSPIPIDVPLWRLVVGKLPPGTSFQFDAAREEVWYTTPDGYVVDGSPMIVLPEGRSLDWDQFQAHDCDADKWIGVRTDHLSAYGAEAVVSVSTVSRSR